MRNAIGERLLFVNGMPTAETYARSFRGIGIPLYSSAVFNFVPRTALAFHRALNAGDKVAIDALLRDFFIPYVRIRNRQPGYAVSIVKAGVSIVGRGAGPAAAVGLHGGRDNHAARVDREARAARIIPRTNSERRLVRRALVDHPLRPRLRNRDPFALQRIP